MQEKLKSSNDSNEDNKEESKESDYDYEDKDQIEEGQEQKTVEITINQVF
jgi:hypothetical protein